MFKNGDRVKYSAKILPYLSKFVKNKNNVATIVGKSRSWSSSDGPDYYYIVWDGTKPQSKTLLSRYWLELIEDLKPNDIVTNSHYNKEGWFVRVL